MTKLRAAKDSAISILSAQSVRRYGGGESEGRYVLVEGNDTEKESEGYRSVGDGAPRESSNRLLMRPRTEMSLILPSLSRSCH